MLYPAALAFSVVSATSLISMATCKFYPPRCVCVGGLTSQLIVLYPRMQNNLQKQCDTRLLSKKTKQTAKITGWSYEEERKPVVFWHLITDPN